MAVIIFVILLVITTLIKESSARVLLSSDSSYSDLAENQYLKEPAGIEIDRREFPEDAWNAVDWENYDYDLNLNVMGNIHRLKLRKPEESIFAPNFQFHEVDVDEFNNPVFKDVTPPRDQIDTLESTIFLDQEADAVMHVHEYDGDYHLDGYVKGGRIKREIADANGAEGDTDHSITSALSPNVSSGQPNKENDVVDLQRPIVLGRAIPGKVTAGTVEVGFVVDFAISQKLEFKNDKIISYLAVMLNSVNIRYSLVDDPKLTFKFTGIYIIKTQAAQPFIETSKNGKKFTIGKVLDKFAAWAAAHMKEVPAHDVLPLLTHIDSDSDAMGVAYLRGACWKTNIKDKVTVSNTVSVVIDDGVTYSGSYTMAHELAHSLGSPHDGTDASKDCAWKDGHLMSYEGWGKPNKFQFSKCSKRNMKQFIGSSGGTCVNQAESKTYVNPVPQHVGDVLSPTKQCQIETKSPLAFAADDGNANEFCRRVVCKIPMAGKFLVQSKNRPPGFRTPCGKGGICAHGICTNNKEDPKERLDLNKLCIRKTRDPKARLVVADSGDAQCKNLICAVAGMGGSTSAYPFGPPEDGSFPCGAGGTCKDKKCVGSKEDPKAALDLNKACARRMGNPQAALYAGTLPSEYCKVLKCQIPTPTGVQISGYPDFIFPENSGPCGDGGKCVKKACVGESADRFDMNKVCKKKIGSADAKLNTAAPPGQQCKKLSCTYLKAGNTYVRGYDFAPPDGSFPCGPNNGKCRGGNCMPK